MKKVITIIGQIRPMSPMGLMGRMRLMGLLGPMALLRLLVTLSFIICHFSFSVAQIKIGGNVYGGGNKGLVEGNTKVTVQKVDQVNNVFGGARQANVGGRAHVNIDGAHATGDIFITNVYGGNDISGTIGTHGDPTQADAIPTELTEAAENNIDNSWNAFVQTSRSTKTEGTGDDEKTVEDKWILIGSLFGGGNGDYDYEYKDGEYRIYRKNHTEGDAIIAKNTTGFVRPELGKTYLELKGGEIAHVYGGGNNATVTENTTICIDNESDECLGFVTSQVATTGKSAEEVIGNLKEMAQLNSFQSNITDFAFNHARVFGGNNKAEMSIRPTWNLKKGIIRDLYSGGNQGNMTSPEGLLLEIAEESSIQVNNLYGGCRMADVIPTANGIYTPCTNLPGYHFPAELSARVLVRGGHINNVYGGNDITGKVYGGNAIGIYTTIYGDVYGGGNGAYAYTDQSAFRNSDVFGDFYYSTEGYASSLAALNAHRPNAEQVSIRLAGSGPGANMTNVHGSIFIGGNCASLATVKDKPLVELKIGSYVVADKVFLGNNGEKMIDPTLLSYYAGSVDEEGNIDAGGTDYSTGFDLTTAADMASYMDGAAMPLQPRVVFDDENSGDPASYVDNTSYVGSFYCGGNVGSMTVPGKNTYSISRKLNIFEKFVGGCNNSYVPPRDGLNAAYDGGILGSAAEQADYWDVADVKMKDRLEINLENLTITPLRWKNDQTMLIWNTNKWDDDENDFVPVDNNAVDKDTRLLGGNVYGGCYNSGHVNGNVTININEDVLNRSEVFGNGTGPYGRKASGVELYDQRDDVMAVALSVFGAGYGEETEIWGSTTVNLNKGYVFQIFGGGEQGVVGKKDGSGDYVYNPAYSSTVNLKGLNAGYSESETGAVLAETEYIYGGGNEGDVCGNTLVNLGNGRIYDAFGGASNADILGHTEVYIGRSGVDGSGNDIPGFPWIRDIVYGGNDFGGTIHGEGNLKGRVRVETGTGAFDVLGKVHNPDSKADPDVLKASSYVEYLQGRVDTIFGGSYGNYDYTLEKFKDDEGHSPTLPSQNSSFVNIRPNKEYNSNNRIVGVFGGGTGYPGNRDGDRCQNRSYVLVDIPDNLTNFRTAEIFGAGSYNGMGMKSKYQNTTGKTLDENDVEIEDLDNLSAIVDLVRGKVGAAYGGSFNEGVTRRTMVNVPVGSTINIGSIFGGAYGQSLLAPCDVYEAHVNYSSTDATLVYNDGNPLMKGAIYGGNNTCRRTLYGFIDIDAPVWQQHPKWGKTRATVYGAGCGPMTWSEYSEVNLKKKPDGVTGDYTGAEVYEVYGGAQNGEMLNAESAKAFMNSYLDITSPTFPSYLQALVDENGYSDTDWRTKVWPDAWTLGEGYYTPYTQDPYDGTWNFITGNFDSYATNEATNLSNPLTCTEDMDDRETKTYKYNSNVRIHEGAYVANYAYGGGLGSESMPGSGDVYGTTYIALLGGEVKKDIYAAGTIGVVYDNYMSGEFIASANAYIKGGTCRNVYGGGWEGSVGKHDGDLSDPYYDFENDEPLDIPGETHVVIGDLGEDKTFANGKPAIQRNVYGGGEGGSVYGATHLTINNGMIGYRWKNNAYVEELDDKEAGDGQLDGNGNAFGGGYILNSFVDNTNVKMLGGQIRGSLYGGGEVGPVGRGTMKSDAPLSGGVKNGNATIYKAGKTHVEMYNGHVLRNVFGGGRGKDSWDGDGTYSMDPAVVATLDHDSKGFIFGQTEVDIYGGEVGTDEGMVRNFGNVFGGGDEGTVVSAYEKSDHTLGIGKKIGNRYDDDHEGYYFKYENGGYLTEGTGTDTRNVFTEDCKVLVEPWLQVKKEGGIDFDTDGDGEDESYPKGSYIPTAYLNTLKAKTGDSWPATWDEVDVGKNVVIDDKTVFKERGIVIHNAVFAGGNIALGSNSLNANEVTVYGNATASIHDVYNRDFITIGTGHTGGLYGDGNLTLVDGYRELNITNYGSDKFHLADELGIEAYNNLPDREKAYYEVKYKCIAANGCTDREGTVYKGGDNGATLPLDELLALFTKDDGTSIQNNASGAVVESGGTAILTANASGQLVVPNPAIWRENGVVSTYAGRIMNTIQRADFCGVFGSRMVMKGARDRVPDKEDSKLYTINRVREVSLNKMETPAGDTDEYNVMHGNYFGIYSNVNYFGSLTSDVDFHTTTRTTNANIEQNPGLAADGKTFAEWKAAHKTERSRNNGYCYNQLALASGVYLELTTEKSTGTTVDKKDWGLITGVVELDLINVQTGVGGGYVYAKNEHGKRIPGHSNTTLTALNNTAVSKWNWGYETADALREEWETSGNFIHSSQTIIDDCYNESARYLSTNFVKAHYWFISGQVYVYDQYITAHTGSPNAYSETVELPITINAASNGKMTLMDVQPNLYAYYSSYTNASTYTKLSGDAKVVINNSEYHLNDPISYWDWYKLPLSERRLFVEDTYVIKEDCKIRNTSYTAGTVLLKKEYDALAPEDDLGTRAYPPTTHVREVDGVAQDVAVPFIEVVRSSNNMSHDTGYLLVYNMTNPEIWKPWYTELSGDSRTNKITTAAYDVLPAATTTVESVTTLGKDAYYDGPTYTPLSTGLYGQREYDVMDIIPENIYNDYQTLKTGDTTKGYIPTDDARKQAEFVPAHIVTKEYTGSSTHYYPGAPVSAEISGYTAPAYVCTSTIELSSTEYIYVNDLMTEKQKNDYKTAYPSLASDIDELIVPAYYCTTAGLYGGDVYVQGKNYRALNIWSTMPETERENFTFNYDALDLLVDPTYGVTYPGGSRKMQKEGTKYQYDGYNSYSDSNKEKMIYSLSKPIDYTATYNGNADDVDYDSGKAMQYTDASATPDTHYVKVGAELSRTEYEALPNEQRHYAPVTVKVGDVVQDSYTVYVVKDDFVHIETPYAVGSTVSADDYARLTSDEKANVITLTFSKGELDKDGDTPKTTTFYYCRESYEVNEKGMGHSVKSVKGEDDGTTYDATDIVPKGAIIADGDYSQLPNKQKKFTIHGKSPMETSTLYVSRQSDINDLSKEKIITVIYKYDYEESDVSGLHVTPVSERHIVNIHIKFESGVPIVDDIRAPGIVLPGTSINMRIPTVTPGSYEILGGGWELFEKDTYAENHTNGMAYKPSVDSLYWYQDGYLLAYYAKTYLGKTYSNAVPVSVANYHDLKKVMDDKKYHLHVDYDRSQLKRNSKIYINDYSSSSQNGLDLFKNFYDLSLLTTTPTGTLEGHSLLNTDATNGVKAGHNLDFFLRTDISHTDPWTPIASTDGSDPCFNGTLHGDGHTISGLDNSLFGKLCGSVYNLGVTGSFTSAGVADEGDGYVESCWVKTTNETPLGSKPYAVFGNPTDTKGYQLVNSYFWNGNNSLYNTTTTDGVTTSGGARGKARAMTAQEFYNGTVAYNLNNFYLYKRYNDHAQPGGTTSYKYWQPGNDTPQLGTYASNAANCSSGYNGIKYVEERYADGDFRYAAGTIPGSEDERHYVESTEDLETHVITETDRWAPIWPDDYLFFGQKLTYGYSDTEAHQTLPSAIVKNDNNRLTESEQNNRVYRAPAYYGNSTMGVAHFNPTVYLAQTKKGDAATKAYPGMTAIDFRGHNDVYGANGATKAYELGLNGGKFYAPLLDDDGLTDITNCDETKNLLVYAPASGDNEKTHTVLTDYFEDPDYDTYYDNSAGYRLVRKNDKSVYGHLIQSNLIATNDHLLVDKQDFNCPIAYRFDDSHLMWYQRIPEETEYVTPVWSGTPAKRSTKGWQGVSIPFTAELVTTSDKGEITHFYGGSQTSKNGTDSKIGHEYWLREFKAGGTVSGKVYEAKMNYPDAAGGNKEYTNTFLWDYYYKYSDQKDANDDTYQTYYKTAHTHSRYPLLTGAKPYIIGLPSATYYEFDLSGSFEAQNTKVKIDRLGQQIITFASEEGVSIKVSDAELNSTGSVTNDGYTFKASYANKELETGTFVMNSDGNAYHQLSDVAVAWNTTGTTYADATAFSEAGTLYTDPDGTVEAASWTDAETTYYTRTSVKTTQNDVNKVKTSQYAFRPYFVTAAAGSRSMTRSIIFGGANAEEIKEGPGSVQDGGLEIYVRNHKIVTTSHLKEAMPIQIVSVSGVTMANYMLQPGETVETPIRVEGAYIVNKKKLLVK